MSKNTGWTGLAYTWDNRQSGDANVKARLDRAFANEAFRQAFEHVRVRHISSIESDHCFVVADIREPLGLRRQRGCKQFRYENVWQSHSDYDQLVADTWQCQDNPPTMQGVLDSLKAMQRVLEPWGRVISTKLPVLQQNLRNDTTSGFNSIFIQHLERVFSENPKLSLTRF